MAYCPQCEVEQRCGCDECHACGTPLVSGPAPGEAAGKPAAGTRGPDAIHPAGAEVTSRLPAHAAEPARWLTPAFMFMGFGLLVVCVFEAFYAVTRIPATREFVISNSDTLGTIAGYANIILYSNSVRLLAGFGFLLVGLFAASLEADSGAWRRLGRVTGVAMGSLALVYWMTFVLLSLPFGHVPYRLGGVMPPLWIAAPAMLTTGTALACAGYLAATWFGGDRASAPKGWRNALGRTARGGAGRRGRSDRNEETRALGATRDGGAR